MCVCVCVAIYEKGFIIEMHTKVFYYENPSANVFQRENIVESFTIEMHEKFFSTLRMQWKKSFIIGKHGKGFNKRNTLKSILLWE